MNKKSTILIIDDFPKIIEHIETKFEEVSEQYHIISYHMAMEVGADKEKAKKKILEEIGKKIKDSEVSYIITSYMCRKRQNETDKNSNKTYLHLLDEKISLEDLLEEHFLKKAEFSSLKKVIVHTYSPNLFWSEENIIRERLEKQFKKANANAKVLIVDTSSMYRVPLFKDDDRLFVPSKCNGENSRRVDMDNIDSYVTSFGLFIKCLIEEVDSEDKNKDRKKLLFIEQYETLKRIKSLNQVYVKKGDMKEGEKRNLLLKPEDEYKVGHLTYIDNTLGFGDDYQVFKTPYKHYYDSGMDSDLERIISFYKLGEKFTRKAFCYYDYTYSASEKGGPGEFSLYQFHSSNQLEGNIEELKNLLPILHSTVFFDEHAWKLCLDKKSKQDDCKFKLTDNSTITIKNEKGKEGGEKIKTIKLMFLFTGTSGLKIKNINSSSIDNHIQYSFWKIDNKSYDKTDIKDDYERLYNGYHMLIKEIARASVIGILLAPHSQRYADEQYFERQNMHNHLVKNVQFGMMQLRAERAENKYMKKSKELLKKNGFWSGSFEEEYNDCQYFSEQYKNTRRFFDISEVIHSYRNEDDLDVESIKKDIESMFIKEEREKIMRLSFILKFVSDVNYVRGCKIECEIDDNDKEFSIEKFRYIYVVISNLWFNAKKYASTMVNPDKRRIKVKYKVDNENNENFKLSIANRGKFSDESLKAFNNRDESHLSFTGRGLGEIIKQSKKLQWIIKAENRQEGNQDWVYFNIENS